MELQDGNTTNNGNEPHQRYLVVVLPCCRSTLVALVARRPSLMLVTRAWALITCDAGAPRAKRQRHPSCNASALTSTEIPVMASMTTVEQEVQALEQQYWNALRDADIDTLLRLTDNPCVVAGAQGAAKIDHAAYRAMMQTPQWKLNTFTIGDLVTHVVSDDVVVNAYTVREEMTVEGKPLTLEAADASTWVRRDDGWVCVLHTESKLGDPFGR